MTSKHQERFRTTCKKKLGQDHQPGCELNERSTNLSTNAGFVGLSYNDLTKWYKNRPTAFVAVHRGICDRA